MDSDWLEISDKDVNVEEIMQQIRERIARRGMSPGETEVPTTIAENLWKEMVGDATDESALGKLISIQPRDCDIVPRHYVIDWRVPILGPIHAVVRRIINNEIRRYLFASLEKQALFNRKVLRALKGLAEENARLRQEIEALRGAQESGVG